MGRLAALESRHTSIKHFTDFKGGVDTRTNDSGMTGLSIISVLIN